MFPRLLKSGLILFAVFAVVWLATIAWWQAINRMPTTADIVTHLVLLPAGMVAGYLVIKRALDGIRANVAAAGLVSAASAAAGVGTTAATGDGTPPAASQDATRAWHSALLGSAVRASAGSNAQSLVEAALASTQPGLVTLDGIAAPVFAASIEGLDTEILRATLSARAPDIDWTDEALRALSLAAEVADELAMQAAMSFPPDVSAGNGERQNDDTMQLVVTALLPRHWPEPQQQAANDWLRSHLSLSWPSQRLTLEAVTAKADGDALLLLDRATLALNRPAEGRPTLWILVATDSLIGAAAVERLEQQEQLFSARCPHGRTPGEAAAGLLLSAPSNGLAIGKRQADAAAQAALPPALARVSVTRLDDPTPDRGQPQLESLDNAVALALAVLSTVSATSEDAKEAPSGEKDREADTAQAIAAVVTDTGIHPVRTAEVARVFSTHFPKLDASADLIALGVPCGYTGAAGGLLPVVVAHHLAREAGRPVLALTASDTQQRGAVAILPSLT